MFSYETYKLVHLLGLFSIFTALGARTLSAINGGTKASDKGRGLTGMLHGLGLVLALVGGFGMLARLGMTSGLPGWTYAKIGLWVLVAGLLALPYRVPSLAKPLLLLPLLGMLGGWIAVNKPF